MASNALECDICFNAFSDYNRPRILPCSHTFCGQCIDEIIATQKKTCPTCRRAFAATSAEDLMINRIVLDVITQLSTIDKKDMTKEFRKKLTKESIQETKSRVLGELRILEEMKGIFAASETLNKMKDGLLDTKKEIGRFRERLRDTELSIEHIIGKIDESGNQMKAASDLTLSEPLHDTQENVQKIKELLKKNQTEKDDINQEIFKMKIRLGNDTEKMQKFARFAVKVNKGKQMVGLVGVTPTKQICWSHIEREILPEGLSIKHEALMNTSSRRGFLDLAIGGTFLSRVVIKTMDEGNLALNFLHVCAGDLGPSYANSQLSRVGLKDQDGEYILVLGYEKSVMKVNWNEEGQREIYKRMPLKAGEVRGWFSDEKASHFYIASRDNPNWTGNNCFGIVEEGMDALRDAISRYPDISSVQIVDCGLMFSL